MNRAERRAAKHSGVARGSLRHYGHRKLTRWDAEQVKLELLYDRRQLHAGPAKGPGPGRPLCDCRPSMFQHPLFARDPNFAPDVKLELRHQYALAALQLNDGCERCIAQLLAIGEAERIDPAYPFLDPQKAVD